MGSNPAGNVGNVWFVSVYVMKLPSMVLAASIFSKNYWNNTMDYLNAFLLSNIGIGNIELAS
jgi:hypothetical protein